MPYLFLFTTCSSLPRDKSDKHVDSVSDSDGTLFLLWFKFSFRVDSSFADFERENSREEVTDEVIGLVFGILEFDDKMAEVVFGLGVLERFTSSTKNLLALGLTILPFINN